MRKTRGFTIAEVLIYCSLLSMILYAVYGVAIAIFHYQRIAEARTGVQLNAIGALNSLSHDIEESRSAYITRETVYPFALLMPSPRDMNGNFQYDSTGLPLWQTYVAYYVDITQSPKVLVRAVQPIQTVSNTPPAALPRYNGTTFMSPNVSHRSVGVGVTAFNAVEMVSNTPFWQVSLSFRQDEYQQDNTFSITTSIFAVNN
jgi:Tfp pilus assembly protein PilV